MARTTNSTIGPVRLVTVSLPPLLAFALDGMVAQDGAKTRSAFVTKLIRAEARRRSRKPVNRAD
jgi:metal-responsive CopG/Arc/MetJ family transcriptional regulator